LPTFAVERTVSEPTVRPPGVLLVDDQAVVRDTLARWLQHNGFIVWPAAGGGEAVALLACHASAIDLALIDQRMPGLDGLATLKALRAACPALVCCLMGGHIDETTDQQALRAGAACVLDKPLLLRDLAGTLRGLLPGGQGQSASVEAQT
jgi:two-component system C4-dicarboxylate transport response regulator DctD